MFVQPALFTDRTRMFADVCPRGNTKNWNGALALYGASATSCLKQVALVMRQVITWFPAAGAERVSLKSIGLPAMVLVGLGKAAAAKP